LFLVSRRGAGGTLIPLWQERDADPPCVPRSGLSADWTEEQVCHSGRAPRKSGWSVPDT